MAFEHVGTTEFQSFFGQMQEIKRAELWALKVQVYLEFRLKELLLQRLGVLRDEPKLAKKLRTIGYQNLLLLSLAGARFDRLREHLEKLNNVRIEVAHKFQATDYIKPLRTFVTSVVKKPWPDDYDEQLTATQMALAMVMAQVELTFKEFQT